jgi:CheY-like chemotaxis protein
MGHSVSPSPKTVCTLAAPDADAAIDMVVCDINMLRMDGLTLLAGCRSVRITCHDHRPLRRHGEHPYRWMNAAHSIF